MLNKLRSCIHRYRMIKPGDQVVCAVSGGADSMALLWAMYCLRDDLQIALSAAHLNHGLRGGESDRDEAFVRDFCARYDIPFYSQKTNVIAGEKGLEAAAREARYAFFQTLSGKIATAHTANDNAETVLMHMVRGTGLKGLGGISPVKERVIRPMLTVTREEVLAFLREYHIRYVEDSSNQTDQFLRNRLRHHVMPILEQENPRLYETMSSMAMGLREDEMELEHLSQPVSDVKALRNMSPSKRSRSLIAFMKEHNVIEPEREHVALLESLVFSQKPSARASFPGGITISRNYGNLEVLEEEWSIPVTALPCPGKLDIPEIGLRICCQAAAACTAENDCFTVHTEGKIIVRARKSGDSMRLSGGTRLLKKLFIDRKIPHSQRDRVPVVADENGVLGVYGFGPNLERLAKELPAVQIRFETLPTQK